MTRMRVRTTRTLLIGLLLGLILPWSALAQASNERATTEQRLRELRQQIAHGEQQLSETEEAEQATLQTLRSLDRELAIRTELTSNYQTRLAELAERGATGVLTPQIWLAFGLLAIFPFIVRGLMHLFGRQGPGGSSPELLEAGRARDMQTGDG